MSSETPRSWLYTPADRPDALGSAQARRAAARIIDLEDGCRQERLDELRRGVPDYISALAQDQAVWVRIHSPAVDREESQQDIEAIISRDLTGVVIPKVMQRSEVDLVAAWIIESETRMGSAPHAVEVGVMIETPASIENVSSLAQADRVTTLLLGRHDLEWRLSASAQSATMDYVRSRLIITSAAAGIQAPVEAPWMQLDDMAGLQASAVAARLAGFGGMQCVHPSQLEIVDGAFRPAPEELAWARRVLAAHAQKPDAVVAVDGEVVDAPVIGRAMRIVEDAESPTTRRKFSE